MKRPVVVSPRNAPYRMEIIGAERTRIQDYYHAFLQFSWARALGTILVVFVLLNLFFATLYLFSDGIANARPGSMFDAFSFSVQTLATIGYGSMYPVSHLANVIVWCEAFTGLVLTAVVTGLVFAKFSLSGARIVFSNAVTITLMDGVPTLMFRVGNARSNTVADASVRVVLLRTERTAEGTTLYRMHDLPLLRERTPALTRSWMVLHRITPDSLLHGYDTASMEADEVELGVTVVGTDDTSLQPVHARHTYFARDILWGRRLVDILSERADGTMVLDLTRFHDHEESPPGAAVASRSG